MSRREQSRGGAAAGVIAAPETPVYLSLVRPSLTMGVERHVAALEVVLCLALVFGLGLSLLTVAVVLAVVAAVHPAMLWLTQKEPRATELYLRNRGYADFYQPHADARADLGGPASLRAPTHWPRPTLPPLT